MLSPHTLCLDNCLNTCERSNYIRVENGYPIKLPLKRKRAPRQAHNCVTSRHCLKERRREFPPRSPICLTRHELIPLCSTQSEGRHFPGLLSWGNWPVVYSARLQVWLLSICVDLKARLCKLYIKINRSEDGKTSGKPWEVSLIPGLKF